MSSSVIFSFQQNHNNRLSGEKVSSWAVLESDVIDIERFFFFIFTRAYICISRVVLPHPRSETLVLETSPNESFLT